MIELKDEISEISIAYAVTSTAHYFKMAGLQFFKEKNIEITPEQFAILVILSKQNGLYQRQLAQIALKDRPNITRIVDILEKHNFVCREIDPDNRRIVKVFITEDGVKLVHEIIPLIQQIRNKAVEGIQENEIILLKQLLKKIRNNLEETFTMQY